MDPYGAIEIVGGPTEHKRNRTNSAIILSLNKVDSGMGSTLGSPKSRSRSVHITARQGSIGTHNRKYTNELSWIYDLNNRNNHGRSEKHMGLKRIHPRPPHVHEHGENHKTMTSELRLKSASSDSILYHAMQTRHLQDRNSSSNDENINNNSMEMKYDNQNNATDRSGDDKSRESLDLDVELQNLPRPTSIDTKMEDNHNYLKLSRGNLQTTPAITPAMTPNSDRYLSAARHSSSISSLTKQDSTSTTSHDSPLRTIAKALVDNEIKYTGNSIIIHQDAINKSDDDLDVDDQESLTKNMNDSDDEEEKKSNNTKAANIINLSPIHENNVNFKEYKKKKMNIEVFSYGTTGPDYVKRPNGKAVRVGFKSPKTYSRRPISPLNDPYNFKCNVIHSDNDTNSNETTIVDDETEDDGMDAADDNSEESEPGEEVESGLYSDNSNDIDNEVP